MADPRIVNGGLFPLCWGLAQVSCDSSPAPTPLPSSLGFVEVEFVFYLFFHFPQSIFSLVLVDRGWGQ